MIKELDRVVLTTELPDYSLKIGDIGTVILVHNAGRHTQDRGYEAEFVTLDDETVAVTSLFADQVRSIGRREIAHARPLATI